MVTTGKRHLWVTSVTFEPGEFTEEPYNEFRTIRPQSADLTFIRSDGAWRLDRFSLAGWRVRPTDDGFGFIDGPGAKQYYDGDAPEQFRALINEIRADVDTNWKEEAR